VRPASRGGLARAIGPADRIAPFFAAPRSTPADRSLGRRFGIEQRQDDRREARTAGVTPVRLRRSIIVEQTVGRTKPEGGRGGGWIRLSLGQIDR